ncbi:hypothetical protein [Flavobacterium sp.]|uniref:hypothetical protein n=1 Tax=Flavobacterium sp. TaxID=239 RepID=UPI0025BCDF60|nr:hypothetical protein [Flavobacterium sp.]MBA4277377.1 hypothetical protein [Flavobacterium sp.]
MLDKRLEKKINFIEIYQIIGGVIGFLFTFYLLLTTDLSKYQNGIGYFSMLTPFLFFGFCIFSGILLNKKNYVQGLKLVFISLLMQLIAFDVFGLFYSAINGIGVNLTLNLTNDVIAGFDFYPSQFLLALNSNNAIFIVKINLFTIAMLFYTAKVFQKIKQSL